LIKNIIYIFGTQGAYIPTVPKIKIIETAIKIIVPLWTWMGKTSSPQFLFGHACNVRFISGHAASQREKGSSL
jgi:hypothetical protein